MTRSISDLASALKGDALDLFTNLSAEDRTSLGKLVSSGALSADELNDALSSALKSERKKAFWQSTKEDADAGGTAEGAARQQNMKAISDRMESTLESRYAAMDRPGMSPQDRLAALSKLSADLKDMQDSRDQVAGTGMPMKAYTLKGGDDRFFATSKEQAAGQKLKDLGFHSGTFDKVLASQSKDFAQKYLSEERTSQMSLGNANK
ncbi:hypothetical protein [Azospirillum brasilense]|uniref:Uncharacterized protein n=1 Tax=Azospirillum brasilense TaxID=192 RepID=A0A6L3B5I8_AZOBR|nr:hypothetical protein [Azospirillum brasilense]KAA0687624.1 hypothetical protein DS837_05280 [Azospirillum brasilense]